MSQKPVLVIAEKYGRLGNRILLFAHLIAFAIENGFTVINLAFVDYAHYFETTRYDLLYRFPPGTRRHSRLLRNAARFCNRTCYRLASKCANLVRKWGRGTRLKTVISNDQRSIDIGDPAFLESIRSCSLVFLKGWLFRDRRNLEKHQEQVREYFRPDKALLARISDPIESLRQDSDIVVGVQIRHGDYRDFSGGRYYYSLETYSSLMKHATELFPGKRVSFFICSEQDQNTKCFQEFFFTFRSGDPIEDMYSLATCDYLIGPPSTFTRWASFYGKIPLYIVEDPESPFTLNNFIQIRG